ncbi:hypothetical protein BKA70DRAFT_1410323 [Coprinopsis sp. MPI-PUGE-AT-0042]|nr:hypothetical protein BKA70DRAFT_1410323 [Coprinopsis sp. MPI-PUGE-AT-0042]
MRAHLPTQLDIPIVPPSRPERRQGRLPEPLRLGHGGQTPLKPSVPYFSLAVALTLPVKNSTHRRSHQPMLEMQAISLRSASTSSSVDLVHHQARLAAFVLEYLGNKPNRNLAIAFKNNVKRSSRQLEDPSNCLQHHETLLNK